MTVGWIALWAVLFLVTHLAISSARLRPRLVAALGLQPYRGVYSLVSLATFVPMAIVFALHKHSGPMFWDLQTVAPLRWLAWLLMLTALVTFTAGIFNPSPTGIGARAGAADAPRGILKLTRHPGFVAFSLFGFAHMLMNGWLGDLIFFGTFPALGIMGGWHQDARKVVELGESYRRFLAATSFFPGAALRRGRQRWTAADTPWLAIGVGVALTALLAAFHPLFFGGHPLG